MHEGAIKRAYSKIFQKMEVFTENGDDNEEQVSDSITSKSSQLSISSESENQMVSTMQPNNIFNMPSAIEVEDLEDYTNQSKLQQNSTNFDQALLQNLPEQLRVQQQQLVSRSNPLRGEIYTGENELQQSDSDRKSHTEYLDVQSSPRHSQNQDNSETSQGESQDSVQVIQRAEPQADQIRRKLTVKERRNHYMNSKTKSSIINVAMRSGIFFKQKSILFQSTRKVVIEESLRQVQQEASVQVTDSQNSKRLVSMKQFRSQLSAQNFSTESPVHGSIESPIHEQSKTEKSDGKESSNSISSGSDSINLVNINQIRDKTQGLSVSGPKSKDSGVANIIEQIWQKYDIDGSGDLDKQETKKFVVDSLQLLGTDEQLSDKAFDQIYDEFDIDKSGTIEKNEMENFVQKILISRSYSSQQVTQALKEQQKNQVANLPPQKTLDSISEEIDSSDEDNDVKDSNLAIQYVKSMHKKLYKGKKYTNQVGISVQKLDSTEKKPGENNGDSDFSEFESVDEDQRTFEQVTFRILTDSIIKSFMITFTDPGNKNLLMNPDLVEIALNCIEFGIDIKTMAQLKTARLLSLILEFPKIQKRVIFDNDSQALIGMYNLIKNICQIEPHLHNIETIENLDIEMEKYNKVDKRKVRLITQVQTLKFLIQGVFLVCKSYKLWNNAKISEGIQSALLGILNCKNILRHLDQMDKFYLLTSVRNIHTQSDYCIQQFTEKSHYKLMFNIIFDGIDLFVGNQPRIEHDQIDQVNFGGISISNDINLEISNICLSILQNMLKKKQIAKQILDEQQCKEDIFGVIKKSLSESDDWQTQTIFKPIKIFLKMIDHDVLKQALVYSYSSKKVQDKITYQNNDDTEGKKLKIQVKHNLQSINSIQSDSQLIKKSPQQDLSDSDSCSLDSNNPYKQPEQKLSFNIKKFLRKIEQTPESKLKQLKQAKKQPGSIRKLVRRSSSSHFMQNQMNSKQDRIERKKKAHTKKFKDHCKHLFLLLQIRINSYNLIVGISNVGLKTNRHRASFQKDLFDQNQLMQLMAKDLEQLCELISKSNEFKLTDKQMIETPVLELDLVDEMRRRQHELFMDLFDCIMNCLRVIQCDLTCINHFLIEHNYSQAYGEVKASSKVLNSITTLAQYENHRSKKEIIQVFGVILIEKMSQDVEMLKVRTQAQNFDGIKVVSQVISRLFTLFTAKKVFEPQSKCQCECEQEILVEMISLTETLLNHTSQIIEDRHILEKTISYFIDENILQLLFECIDFENRNIVLNSLELLSLALKNHKIYNICQKPMLLDCIEEQCNEDQNTLEQILESKSRIDSPTPKPFIKILREQPRTQQNSPRELRVQLAKKVSIFDQSIESFNKTKKIDAQLSALSPDPFQSNYSQMNSSKLQFGNNSQKISIKEKLLKQLKSDSLIFQKDSKIQMALSRCLLQLCMFGQKRGSDEDSTNQKRYCKFLVKIALSKNYQIEQDPQNESEFSFDAQRQEHESQKSNNLDLSPENTSQNQIALQLSNANFSGDIFADFPDNPLEDENKIENEAFEHFFEVLTFMVENLVQNSKFKILKSLIESGLIKLCQKVLYKFIALVDGSFKTRNENDNLVYDFIELNMPGDSRNISNSLPQIAELPSVQTSLKSKRTNFYLKDLQSGAIQVAKNMTQILLDLSSVYNNSPDPEQSIAMIYHLILKTQYLTILKCSMFLIDLEVQSNIIKTIGNLLMLGGTRHQKKLFIQGTIVEKDFIPFLIANLEAPTNAWLTLKNLSNNIFDQIQLTDPHVFLFYQKIEQRKQGNESTRLNDTSISRQKQSSDKNKAHLVPQP